MKKKSILHIYLLLAGVSLFSLEYKDPLVTNVAYYQYFANMETDLERYKSYIANGDLAFINYPYLNDLLLGTLNNQELRLFRNMIYAAKGYIFDDEALTEYFSKFDWYIPKSKNILLSPQEERCVNQISAFEKQNNSFFEFPNQDIILEQFNGGADQKGCIIKLNKNKTFEYTPSETINRVKKITGLWNISHGKINLEVQNMTLLLGGYISAHPTTPYITEGYLVTQNYIKPIIIHLPMEDTNPLYDNHKKWIRIGNNLFCY